MSTQVSALRRFTADRVRSAESGRVDRSLIVSGATGGAGASTAAALLALACAADGRRTLLIDTDDIVGSLHILLGVNGEHGFASLQDPGVTAQQTLRQVTDNCWLVPGGIGGGTNHVPFGTSERRVAFRRIAQLYPEFDQVIIDARARLDGIIAAAGRGAWRFIAVTGVESVALASSYALVKALETRWNGVSVEILVTRTDERRARLAYEQIHAATHHFLSRGIAFGGSIPFDATLAEMTGNGQSLSALPPDSAAHRAVTAQAIRLLAELDATPHDTPVR